MKPTPTPTTLETSRPATVALTVPADTAHLRHIRVLAATVADDAGFDVAAIELLRVAVDELCALAIADARPGAVLTTEYTLDDGGLTLAGRCGPVDADPEVDPIAERLIAAAAQSHDLHRDGDLCVFALRSDRASITTDDR